MDKDNDVQTRLIAWNGAQIYVPVTWEVRISGHSHLIFEHDFKPLMEIRWETGNKSPAKQYKAVLQRFIKGSTADIYQGKKTAKWQQFDQQYEWTPYSHANGRTLDGGICRCRQCNSLIFFHLFERVRSQERQAVDCLNSLLCHGQSNGETLWSVQDFNVVTPPTYLLTDYTFAAGLTRLSFSAPYTTLHICKLGPAKARLNQQSMQDILITLSGTSELTIQETEEQSGLEGYRTPSIGKQVRLRLRREKPFVWTKIWHDMEHDRLLSVVLSSTRPLHQEIAQSICKRYEII